MNLDDIPLFSMLKGRMGYLAERQRVIAENVANADTPGYQARDLKPFSFETSLASQGGGGGSFSGSGMLQPTQSQSGHMALPPMPGFGGAGPSSPKVVQAKDSETTLNGNGVVLEEEMMKMTEARMDYDAAVGFYQKALGLLRMAARAPGR
jgi:flagellar basal-body rod protein FlgB